MKMSFTPGPGVQVLGRSDGVEINPSMTDISQEIADICPSHLLEACPPEVVALLNHLLCQLRHQSEIIRQQQAKIESLEA